MKTNQKGNIEVVSGIVVAIFVFIILQAYDNTKSFETRCEYLGGVALRGDMLGNCYKDGGFIDAN